MIKRGFREANWMFVLLALASFGFNACERAVTKEDRPVDLPLDYHSAVKDSNFRFINDTVQQYLRTEMVGDTNLLIRLDQAVVSFLSEAKYAKIEDKWFVFSGFVDSNPGATPYEMVILNLKNRQANFIAFDSLRDFRWVACDHHYLLEVDYGRYGNYGHYGDECRYYKKLLVLNENNRFSMMDIPTKATLNDFENVDNDNALDCIIAVNKNDTIHVSAPYENNGVVKQADGSLAIQNDRLVILKQLPKWNNTEVMEYDTNSLFTIPFPDK